MSPQEDRALVDRCLAGETKAWEELYGQFHPWLLAAIRATYPRANLNSELIDEIAARTWFAAVTNDRELLRRFDPERGCRFGTFLSAIARHEALQFFRSERRRKSREGIVSRPNQQRMEDSKLFTLTEIGEFLHTLTQRERQYCDEILLELDSPEKAGFSESNGWKLASRVRAKLGQFLND